MRKSRLFLLLAVGTAAIWLAGAFLAARFSTQRSYNFQTPKLASTPQKNPPKDAAGGTTSEELPEKIYLPVPFTPQAPTGNWDTLHNEACEEAVSIMAAAYFASSTGANLAPAEVEQAIAKLTAWQDQTYGYHLDTTAAETARMLETVFQLKTRMVKNFTAQDLKTALNRGRLVAISENGQLLGNPYYKRPGPLHHMLLIKGYGTDNSFITNDSGTKRGLNYPYAFETLFEAAADWDHTQGSVDAAQKIAIEIWR